MDKELRALKPIMRMDAKEISPKALLSIDMKSMMTKTHAAAPTMWELMSHAARTRRQSRVNKYKTPNNVSTLFIANIQCSDPVSYSWCSTS
jgi:hypothetical protein